MVIWMTHLGEDHGGDLLGREGLGLLEVLNLDHGLVTSGNDLERPGLDVLLDDRVIEAATDKTPDRGQLLVQMSIFVSRQRKTDLISKMVLAGFMAAWFFAASPMRRSSSVKETKEGVVKLPCSLATKRRRKNLVSRAHRFEASSNILISTLEPS